jgi:hypothetical protein
LLSRTASENYSAAKAAGNKQSETFVNRSVAARLPALLGREFRVIALTNEMTSTRILHWQRVK